MYVLCEVIGLQGSDDMLSEASELEQQVEAAQLKLAACGEHFASAKE